MKPQRITPYLLLRTVLIASGPFALFLFLATALVNEALLVSARQGQSSLAKTLAEVTQARLDKHALTMKTLADHLDAGLVVPRGAGANLALYGQALLKENLDWMSLWVLDAPTGTVQATVPSTPGAEGFDASRSAAYRNAPPHRVFWSAISLHPFHQDVALAVSIRTDSWVVVGWVDPRSLSNLVSTRAAGRGFAFVCDAEGYLVAHPDPQLVARRESFSWIPAVREAQAGREGYSRVEPPGRPWNATLYQTVSVSGSGWVVGVALQEEEVLWFLPWLVGGGVTVFLLTVLVIFLGTRRIASRLVRPLTRLIEGTKTAALGGTLDGLPPQPFVEWEEIRSVSLSMVDAVRDRERQIREINAGLEAAVEARTEDLRVTRERFVEAEKLAVLGQMAAGVAHELNTPLGAIDSANRSLADLVEHRLLSLIDALAALPDDTRCCYREVLARAFPQSRGLVDREPERRVRRALADRLTVLGVVEVDEVAESLVDLGLVDDTEALVPVLLRDDAAVLLSRCAEIFSFRRLIEVNILAVHKASVVVDALRSYLYHGDDEVRAVDLEDDLENALTLLWNKIKRGTHVTRDYAGVRAYGPVEKLGQVWMNLINNAIQAMHYEGELVIKTWYEGTWALVSVTDSGPGIPQESQARIFEPFYTTKSRGEGLGLGLDICRKIVDRAQGSIRFESQPGRTTFIVALPSARGES